MVSNVNFYKEDLHPGETWINKEYLVQLNLTGDCPLNCSFCYIAKHKNDFLELKQIKKLWNNLRKYNKKHEIYYRVNLTGGDVFYHPEWKEIARFMSKEDTVVALDPLLNRFWKEEHLELLSILKNKINFVQLNSEVVQESDIEAVDNIGKKVVLKIALYNGPLKRQIQKLKYLSDKFDNVIISVDLIIPQKHYPGAKDSYLIFDFESLKREVIKLKKIFGKRLWLLSTTIKRVVLNQIYFCPVPFGGVYVMPDGRIVPCSRHPHLNTGFNIDNFDLFKYVEKYSKLTSNFCLFENKYFYEFWKEEDNPKNFWR